MSIICSHKRWNKGWNQTEQACKLSAMYFRWKKVGWDYGVKSNWKKELLFIVKKLVIRSPS